MVASEDVHIGSDRRLVPAKVVHRFSNSVCSNPNAGVRSCLNPPPSPLSSDCNIMLHNFQPLICRADLPLRIQDNLTIRR